MSNSDLLSNVLRGFVCSFPDLNAGSGLLGSVSQPLKDDSSCARLIKILNKSSLRDKMVQKTIALCGKSTSGGGITEYRGEGASEMSLLTPRGSWPEQS